MLTLNMIVRDEAETLPTCLKSVKDFVDELVIVDTGSVDGTVGIAESHGAEVHTFKWCDNFSAARNFALSKVKTPWTLWLDADDMVKNPEILPDLCAMAHKQRASGVWSTYVQDESSYQRRLQLFRTNCFKWEGYIHESPVAKHDKFNDTVLSALVVLHRKPHERRPEAAQRYLAILLEKDPTNYLGLAESYKWLAFHGDQQSKLREYIELAEENYHKAYEWPHTNEGTRYICLVNGCILNIMRADFDPKWLTMAQRQAQLGIGLRPDRAECWVLLGQIWEAWRRIEKAHECYTKALSLPRPTEEIGLVFPQYYRELPEQLLQRLEGKVERESLIITPDKQGVIVA